MGGQNEDGHADGHVDEDEDDVRGGRGPQASRTFSISLPFKGPFFFDWVLGMCR